MNLTGHRAGRGIDHLVICVRDLEKAAARYKALGFTVTPRAQHDWGTANQLVQMAGSFLEIIEVAKPDLLLPEQDGHFSFGGYIDDMLKDREGCGMLVFESSDARADRDEFAEKGLSDFAPFDFERLATLPDGEKVTVGFSLSFIAPPELPNAAMFVCQQHAPQHFWKPNYQIHANGVRSVGEVVMIAPDPARLADIFTGLQGEKAATLRDGTLHVSTARGGIAVMTRDGFAGLFGEDAVPKALPDGPFYAGMRLLVDDLGATESWLIENGVSANWNRAGLVVPAQDLFNLALAFVQGVKNEPGEEPIAVLSPPNG